MRHEASDRVWRRFRCTTDGPRPYEGTSREFQAVQEELHDFLRTQSRSDLKPEASIPNPVFPVRLQIIFMLDDYSSYRPRWSLHLVQYPPASIRFATWLRSLTLLAMSASPLLPNRLAEFDPSMLSIVPSRKVSRRSFFFFEHLEPSILLPDASHCEWPRWSIYAGATRESLRALLYSRFVDYLIIVREKGIWKFFCGGCYLSLCRQKLRTCQRMEHIFQLARNDRIDGKCFSIPWFEEERGQEGLWWKSCPT